MSDAGSQLELINSTRAKQLEFQKEEVEQLYDQAERTIANAAQMVMIGGAEALVKNSAYAAWYSLQSNGDTTPQPSEP